MSAGNAPSMPADIATIIAEVHQKARGRTRYEGQEPRRDDNHSMAQTAIALSPATRSSGRRRLYRAGRMDWSAFAAACVRYSVATATRAELPNPERVVRP